MLNLKSVGRASLVFCILATLPLYAYRRPDTPSSGNGTGPNSLCPNSTATPFFAPLDGSASPPPTCTPTSDPNKPNPPSPYPNLAVTLVGTGFTVTVTPALWERGDGEFSSAPSKQTVFSVQFSGATGMHLQSLVIGSKLNGASYMVCASAPNNPLPQPYCIADSSFLLYSEGDPEYALEPTPIDFADTKTTRWDFAQFIPGASVALTVEGFPEEFSKIDKYPNSNPLTAASFAQANFLAIVTDASDNILTAGGLSIKTALAAKNDLFANAINITKVPFKSFVNTSATSPTEILSGTGAGGEVNPQSDPIPQDPALRNPGASCSGSWPGGASVFRSVWYKFTPSTSDNYAASTANSRYDTGIYVFTGSPSSPTPVACNDDSPTIFGDIVQFSYVNFAASAGTTYYIMVSEVPPPTGTDVTGTIPVAIPLASDATLQFSFSIGSGIVLNPNWLVNFSGEKVGSTAEISITATNTTSTTVNIEKFEIVDTGKHVFAQTNNCGTSVGPGVTCVIKATFTPQASGASYTGYLRLLVSGGTGPTPITLTGFGD